MGERHSRNGGPRVRKPRCYYREPSGRWWWALGLVVSIGAIYHALTADPPGSQNPTLYTLRFVCLGLGGLSISAAEFLPKDRTALAGGLRIGGYALLWIFAALLLIGATLDTALLRP